MRILAFSDWRAQSIDMINEIIEESAPEVILYAGDDVTRVIPMGQELFLRTENKFIEIDSDSAKNQDLFSIDEKGEIIFKKFLQRSKNRGPAISFNKIPVFYVNGNDDRIIENAGNYYIQVYSSVINTGSEECSIIDTPDNKISIHKIKAKQWVFNYDTETGFYRRLIITPSYGINEIFNRYSIFGVECSSGLKSKILMSPDQYADIILTHIPPKGCLDLSTRFGISHIGSKEILASLKKFKPKFVICGHSHFWGGKSVIINNTTVINVSSGDNLGDPGNYVIMDSEIGNYAIRTAEFKNLRQLRGAKFDVITNERIYGSYETIFNHNLLKNDNGQIIKKLEVNKKNLVADRIRSLEWNKPKIIKRLSFNPDDYAFIDIETGLIGRHGVRFIWLIGLLYKGELTQYEYYDQNQMKDFFLFLSNHKITELFSWTKFDSKELSRNKKFKNIVWHDACQRTAKCVIWHTYKLHELYKALLNKPDEDMIDGAIAGIYADHIILSGTNCKYCPPREEVKTLIKERNKMDLIQTYELCKFLWNYKV